MPGPAYQPKPFINGSVSHFCENPSASMDERILGEIAPGDYPMEFGREALKAVRVAAEGCTAACCAVHSDLTLSDLSVQEIDERIRKKDALVQQVVQAASGAFTRHQFLAEFSISMFGFHFRQGQSQTTPGWNQL